jgi:hypothetical protein
MRRRCFLRAAGAALLLSSLPAARGQSASLGAVVHMSPSCGCCGGWVEHVQANGFAPIERRLIDDVTLIKRQLRVPPALWSCHTALIGGYVIEGHVPAPDIRRLLRERPRAVGLAVPGMPIGSPGMPGKPERYASLLFDERSSRIYQQH